MCKFLMLPPLRETYHHHIEGLFSFDFSAFGGRPIGLLPCGLLLFWLACR